MAHRAFSASPYMESFTVKKVAKMRHIAKIKRLSTVHNKPKNNIANRGNKRAD